MADEAGEYCALGLEPERERDLKGSGEEIDGGDASDDSFVMVGGSSEDTEHAERSLEAPDLAGAAGDAGADQVNAGSETPVGGEDGNVEDAVLIDRSSEPEVDQEEAGRVEVCSKDHNDESSVNDASTGEESGMLLEKQGVGESSVGESQLESVGGDGEKQQEGTASVDDVEEQLHSESSGRAELAVKVEEHKTDAEAVDVGEGLNSEAPGLEAELEAAVEVEEHKADESTIEVEEHKADESTVEVEEHKADESTVEVEEHKADAEAVDVGEKLNSEAPGLEAEQEPKTEPVVEVEEEHKVPKAVVTEAVVTGVDGGEESNTETMVAEANEKVEFESAVEVEERQLELSSETTVAEVNDHVVKEERHQLEDELEQLAVPVDVGDELSSETMVAEVNEHVVEEEKHQLEDELEQLAVAVDVREDLSSETMTAEVNEHSEVESNVKVEEHQLEDKLQELTAAVDVSETNVSALAVGEENQDPENQDPEAVATEAKLQELAAAVDVLEKLDFEIKVVEANQLAEAESVVEMGDEDRDSEATVTEAKLQEVSELVEQKHDSQAVVAEISRQLESEFALERKLEYAPNVEEEQMAETVDTGACGEMEPEPSVEDDRKAEVEILVTATRDLENLESPVQEEHQPLKEDVEIDVPGKSQLDEPIEMQEIHTAVTEVDERQEPKSAKPEEEQHDYGAIAAHDQEVLNSVSEAEKLEIAVSDSSNREVDAIQQSDVGVEETDGQEELKSAAEAEFEHQTETAVSDIKAIEVEENQEPESLNDEPSDQPGVVLEVKPETIVERDVENGSPETTEAISAHHVDGTGSAEVPLESGSNEATISTFESSHSPSFSQVFTKESVNEAAVTRGFEVANDPSQESGVCESIDSKDSAVDHDGEMELEHNVVDVECVTSYTEDDQCTHKDDGEKSTLEEVEASDSMPTPPDELSGPSLDGERLGRQAVKTQYCWIIRIPRSNDDELRSKLQHSRLLLDEKTQIRDSIRVELQKKKATLNGYRDQLAAAKEEERNARNTVSAKRQQIDSVQSVINKMKNASSIDEINDKIHHLDRTLQHESLTLTQEKQYIREIKNLKQTRDQISASIGTPKEIQEVFEQRDQIEEQFKTLKKELDSLRTIVLHAETEVKAARKKCDDEFQLMRDLQEQFRVADNHRQEAYMYMHNLRNESNEKIKYFNMYKDDQRTAMNLVNAGDKEGIRSHCSKQVETIMEIWNKDDDFRNQYVKSNVYSTFRRFKTLDGRSLAPDEEPPVLPSHDNRSSSKLAPPSLPNGNAHFPALPSDTKEKEETSAANAAPEQIAKTSQSVKPKKSVASVGPVMVTLSENQEAEKTAEEEIIPKRTKEEEDMARKAEESARKEEELRKEQAAAELKEQHRLEQKAKAMEAEERKRKKAEKDKAKAEYKAKKEAELREKRRAKKEKPATMGSSFSKQVERRKAIAAERKILANLLDTAGDNFPGSDYHPSDRKSWMSGLDPHKLRLNQIVWPGTHDSATNKIGIPFVSRPFAQCQSCSVYRQLVLGARVLDIRVQEDRRICHGILKSVPVDTVISDIKTFLSETESEIIILEIRTEFGHSDPPEFEKFLNEQLGDVLIHHDDSAFNKTISELLPRRVICVWKPRGSTAPAAHGPLWSSGYLKDNWIDTDLPNTKFESNMKHLSGQPTVGARKFFYRVENTATPQADNPVVCVKPVTGRIRGYARLFISQAFARGFADRLQVFSTDFIDGDFVDACVGMTYGRLEEKI